jgi:hypothetical protein
LELEAGVLLLLLAGGGRGLQSLELDREGLTGNIEGNLPGMPFNVKFSNIVY